MARPTNKEAAAKTVMAWTPNVEWQQNGNLWAVGRLPDRRSLIRELHIMTELDETAGAMVYTINTTVSTMHWRHLAQVDGVLDEKDPTAIEAAHFADTLMYDMDMSWEGFVKAAMEIVWSGTVPFDIVMKRRDVTNSKFPDGQWGVDQLLQIDIDSILRWTQDPTTRKLAGLQQMMANVPVIPIWKILHVRSDSHLNSPWGKPLMAPAWRPWKLKTRIQESEAMGIERELCGLPVFRVPNEVLETANAVGDDGQPTDVAKKARAIILAAQKAVSQTRLGPTDGLVLPSDTWAVDDPSITDRTPMYDFELVTGGGQRSIDARSAARDHDLGMMRVLLLQFLRLGDRAGGSYGLSDDQSSMAVKAMGGLAEIVAAEWSNKVLPIAWSLSGRDTRYMPRLSPGDVSKEGLTAIGAFLRGVGAVTDLWAKDEKARASIMRGAGLNYDRDAQAGAADDARETAAATIAGLKEPKPAPGAPMPRAANANKNLIPPDDEEDEDVS